MVYIDIKEFQSHLRIPIYGPACKYFGSSHIFSQREYVTCRKCLTSPIGKAYSALGDMSFNRFFIRDIFDNKIIFMCVMKGMRS